MLRRFLTRVVTPGMLVALPAVVLAAGTVVEACCDCCCKGCC